MRRLRRWYRNQDFLSEKWSRRLDTFAAVFVVSYATGILLFYVWLVESLDSHLQ